MTSAAVLGALAFAGAPSASAAPTDVSESLGKFLGGDVVLGDVDLDTIAEVAGAEAAYPSGTSPETNPLAADVLSTLGIDLTDTLQLLGPNGIVQLGAVNQYAAADADGATAASGAVSDQGGISVGGSEQFPSDATVSLTPLVPADLRDTTVSQLDLSLGALSATAQAGPGAATGDYQIAGATVDLTSPLVGDVYTQLQDAIAPVQASLNGLSDTLTGAVEGTLGVVDASPLTQATTTVDVTVPDLSTVLPSGFIGDGAVQVNLQTGQVSVDLEQLLADDPDLPDLNELPANTEILNGAVVAAIADAVTSTITSIVQDVTAGVRAAVESAAVSLDVAVGARLLPTGPYADVLDITLDAPLSAIDDRTATASVDVLGTQALLNVVLGVLGTSTDALAGTIVNALLAPVGAVFTLVDTLETTLDGITGPLAAEVVSPVLDVLTGVVSLTGNVQEQPGDLPAHDPSGAESFTERALSLRLLSFGTSEDLATVNLASATVRAVEVPSITVDPATVQAGAETTVSGTGFASETDLTVQLADSAGEPVGEPVPVTTDDSGAFTVPLPVGPGTAPGDYTVTATGDPSGITPTAPLAVTAAPSISVDPGTVPAGGTTTVTGENFTPGGEVTVQLTDASGDPVTTTAGDDGTIEASLPTDPGTAAGDYTVVATDASTGATADTALVVTDAPALTLAPTTVMPGGTTTATGTGFTAGADVTLQLTDDAGGPVGDAVTVPAEQDGSFSTPVDVPDGAAAGDYTVVATDVSGATAQDALVVIVPTITADPAIVPAGGSTTVTGDGFTPGSDVTVQLTDDAGEPVGDPVTTTAGDDGSIEADLPTDADTPPGDYTVVATDPAGLTAETPLEVTAAPTIAVDPGTVPAGGTTTVTGDGFTPGSDVTVQLTDDAGEPVGDPVTATAGDDGTIEADLPTDADTPPGDYTVVATDVTGATAQTPLAVTTAPTIAVDPGTAPAGGTTTATGDGFTPGSDVAVQLTDAGGEPVGDPVTVTAGAGGEITTPLAVPEDAAAGPHTVVATDVTGATADAGFVVTGEPAIQANPGTVPAGGSTTITGGGFTPGSEVSVQLTAADGDPVGDPVTATATTDGVIEVGLPTDSGTTPGDHTVVATDVTGATAEAPLEVTAAPTIAVDPTTVPAGGTTTVTGDGFTPGGEVTVQLTDSDGDPVGDPVTTTAGDDSTIEVDLTVPAGATPGQHTVVAEDSTGAPAQTPLEVTAAPTLSADPGTLPAGGTTTVTGDGFTPGSDVSVQLTDEAGDPVGEPVTTTAGADGGFEVDLPVPADAVPGDHSVVAQDVSGATAEAPLTVTAAPTIAVDPGTVPAGGTTTATGNGFTPGSDVTVQLTDDAGEPVGEPVTTTAGEDGTIEVDVTVPADTAPGELTVEATDSSGASAETPLVVTATEQPTLTADPGSVPAGGTTTVSGGGFVPGDAVTVQLEDAAGVPVGDAVDVTVNPDGTFTIVLAVPDDATPGDHVVVATASDGGTALAPLVVTVGSPEGPSIDVNPDTAAPGDTVTVTCEGFDEGTVSVQLVGPDGEPVGDPVECEPGADGSGTVELTVPEDAEPGDHTVVGTGAGGETAEAPLTVTEPGTGPGDRELRAWFSEDEVARGAAQTFYASGFEPGEQVRAVVASEPVNLPVTVADADGVATWTFIVPADFELGIHTGTATSVEVGDSARSTFRVVLADAGVDPETGGAPTAGPTAPGAGPGAPGGDPSTGAGTLPRTGAGELVPLTLLALLLLGAGAGAVTATRRGASLRS